MVSRKPPQKPSTDLALPAAAGALNESVLSIDQAKVREIRQEYALQIDVVGEHNYPALLGYGCAAAFGAVAFGVAVPVMGTFGVIWAAGMTGFFLTNLGGSILARSEEKAATAACQAEGALKDLFRAAQADARNANKRKLFELAEAHVNAGNLLDEESLAYLACGDTEYLKEASDKLAITVYQARKMLAHSRAPDTTEKPLTFAALELNVNSDQHRRLLREKLQRTDLYINEDLSPEFEEIEIKSAYKKQGVLKKIARGFFGPLFIRSDMKRHRSLTLPDLPDVQVTPLSPVKDFARVLRRYEEENGKLDLPALRGWPQKRKALPKPLKY